MIREIFAAARDFVVLAAFLTMVFVVAASAVGA